MELHLPEVRKPSRASPTMVPVRQLLRTRSQAVFIVIFQISTTLSMGLQTAEIFN